MTQVPGVTLVSPLCFLVFPLCFLVLRALLKERCVTISLELYSNKSIKLENVLPNVDFYEFITKKKML
jgi:hypothetical protein